MKLLYLSMLAFVFVVSSALVINAPESVVVISEPKAKTLNPLPVLGDTDSFPILSAQGVMAIDMNSGVILYEKGADTPLLPASTTKIMTALVAMEFYPLDMIVDVGKVGIEGQKMGLVTGEKISVENLLYGLLVFSANDAAEALAANFPGGRDLFINAMNIKAQQYHLDKTHFDNPVGFDGIDHVSTPRDLIILSEVAIKNEKFAQFVSTREIIVKSADGKISHRLENINELLGKVEGVRGIKTGWTVNARENLVTFVERDGKEIILALLGSQDRFGETEELIEWIFANYNWEDIVYSP